MNHVDEDFVWCYDFNSRSYEARGGDVMTSILVVYHRCVVTSPKDEHAVVGASARQGAAAQVNEPIEEGDISEDSPDNDDDDDDGEEVDEDWGNWD